jgi:lysozyme
MSVLLAYALTDSAAAATLRGVDLSHYNGLVDWTTFGSSGNGFVFEKATESVSYTDPVYTINRAGAAIDGLRFGAYHFARPGGSGIAAITANAEAQADYFVSVAQPQPGDLLPVLDLEKSGGLIPADLSAWTQSWLDEVQARLGIKPLIYTGLNFWRDSLADTRTLAMEGYPLWFARYTTAPTTIAPAGNWANAGWTFWQWTHCAQEPGIHGCVDADRYRSADLTPATFPTAPQLPPTGVSPPRIVGNAITTKLLTAVAGAWSGDEPTTFSEQWERCDAAGENCTPIPNATRRTYTPQPADVGHALLVAITATNSVGSASALTPATKPVTATSVSSAGFPKALSAPDIIGTPQAGKTLNSTLGNWSGAPTHFAYQWRRCNATGANCTPIKNASRATYTPLAPDIGHALSLRIAAANSVGTTSAVTKPSRPVLAAPVPPPTIDSQIAAADQAGAVTTRTTAATVTWQPGAVPGGTRVALSPAPASIRALALPNGAVILSLTTSDDRAASAAWPLDLSFSANPAAAIAGIRTNGTFWHVTPSLTTPLLAQGMLSGSYTDATGRVHILTLTGATVGLFRAGAWGDPRYATAHAPKIIRTGREQGAIRARVEADHTVIATIRISLDEQARLSAALLTAKGQPLRLLPRISNFGAQLAHSARTIRLLALTPSDHTLTLATRSRTASRGPATYTIRVTAVDPYGRSASLSVPV